VLVLVLLAEAQSQLRLHPSSCRPRGTTQPRARTPERSASGGRGDLLGVRPRPAHGPRDSSRGTPRLSTFNQGVSGPMSRAAFSASGPGSWPSLLRPPWQWHSSCVQGASR